MATMTWTERQAFERRHGIAPATCKVCSFDPAVQESFGYVHRWVDCSELAKITKAYTGGQNIREIMAAQSAENQRYQGYDPADDWTYAYVRQRLLWAAELGQMTMRTRGRLKVGE